MHLIAHILPVWRGNAGIMQWIITALARNRGIALGNPNQKAGISWDFKALVTPSMESYTAWFAEHVFVEAKPMAAATSEATASAGGGGAAVTTAPTEEPSTVQEKKPCAQYSLAPSKAQASLFAEPPSDEPPKGEQEETGANHAPSKPGGGASE